MRLIYLLTLSSLLLAFAPERLATGYISAPQADRSEEYHGRVQATPACRAPSSPSTPIQPVSRLWSVHSDIWGDIICPHAVHAREYKDNGTTMSATELGYTNQLLTMGYGGSEGKNILLLGIDSREDGRRGRSDIIILLRVVPGIGVLSLSIPRDVKVPLSPSLSYGYEDKIAHMYFYGGVERAKLSVENLLGIEIDHYVVVKKLSDFNRLLSLIRGVDIDKHLEGELGLRWIRNRRFVRGDFERAMRAQVFLEAALSKAWTLTDGGNHRLTSTLARACLFFVETDLSVSDILGMARELRLGGFDPEAQLYTGHLGGRAINSYSPVLNSILSFIDPDPEELKRLSGLFSDARKSG